MDKRCHHGLLIEYACIDCRDENGDELATARAEIAALRAERDEQHVIVARIWATLGSPSYEELAGRSIYDLIAGLQAHVETLKSDLADAGARAQESDKNWGEWRDIALGLRAQVERLTTVTEDDVNRAAAAMFRHEAWSSFWSTSDAAKLARAALMAHTARGE